MPAGLVPAEGVLGGCGSGDPGTSLSLSPLPRLYRVAGAVIDYGHASMKRSRRRGAPSPLRVASLWAGFLAAGIAIAALSAAPVAAQSSATTLPATTTATTAATTTPTTTPPATITTRARPTTTAATTSTTTATSTSTTVTTSTSTTASSSVSGGRIAAIVIIVVVGIALVAALYFLVARNRQRSQWTANAQVVSADAAALASAVERGIPLLRNPNTAAQVWVDLNNRANRVRSGLTSLAASAPDQRASAATTRATHALESLLSAIDTDRGLRLGPPAPTDDQIAYSEALLSQRAVELGRAAQDIEAVATPT